MVNVFAVPGLSSPLVVIANFAVFFICFRECLETSIIVSILLALLKGSLEKQGGDAPYKQLVRQVRYSPSLHRPS
jgi:hypothetical protein